MRSGDRGSASLEFIVVALGVLIPVLALTVSTSVIQRAQFAVTQVARQGVRAYALSKTTVSGSVAVRQIAALTLKDLGLKGTMKYSVTCSPTPCSTKGTLMRLTTTLTVPLVMVPNLPGLRLGPSVPVSSVATHRVPLAVLP